MNKLLIVLILLFALMLRVWKIDKIPGSLYIDEIDMGMQARSILQTGRDYSGVLSPFYVRSYNSDRTPLPIWAVVATSKIFASEELQIRMASVLLGVVIVYLVYLLVGLISGSLLAATISALVFAIAPWQIQFSRIGFEAATLGVCYLAGLILFFKWLRFKNFGLLVAATIVLALSMYSYRTMSLFAPISFIILLVIYRDDFIKLKWKKLLLLSALAIAIMGSFLRQTTIASADQPRISQISIFSDPETSIWVLRNREIDSGDLENPTIGKQANIQSKVFHNKLVSWASKFKDNYLSAWSSEFLFIKGDPNLRHNIKDSGVLLTVDLIGLLVGLFYLVKNLKQKSYQFVAAWLITAPIASALTLDGGNHAHRLYIFSLALLIVIGLGWWQTMKMLYQKNKWLAVLMTLIIVINFSFYWQNYLVHYRYDSARMFGYGYKEAIGEIVKIEDQYDQVYLGGDGEPSMAYYAYWSKTDPKYIQTYGFNFAKVKPLKWTEQESELSLAKRLKTKTLYLLTANEAGRDREQLIADKKIKLIKRFDYPDKEPAFYLVSKFP